MVRVLGVLVVLAGSTGCAFSIVKERREYLERCRQWLELLDLMENEIAFQKSSLPEICSRAGSRLKGSKKLFLERIGQSFQESGDTLGEMWRREAEQIFSGEPLKKEMERELQGLGERLCYEDGDMQRKMLRDVEGCLRKHQEEQESLSREKNRLTLCAGVMGGLLLVILLI